MLEIWDAKVDPIEALLFWRAVLEMTLETWPANEVTPIA